MILGPSRVDRRRGPEPHLYLDFSLSNNLIGSVIQIQVFFCITDILHRQIIVRMMRKFLEVSLLILFETVFLLRFCVAILWRDVIYIKIWYDGSPGLSEHNLLPPAKIKRYQEIGLDFPFRAFSRNFESFSILVMLC